MQTIFNTPGLYIYIHTDTHEFFYIYIISKKAT